MEHSPKPGLSTPPPKARHPAPVMPAWATDKSAQVPSVFQGGFFSNDSSDNLGQVSPGYNPAGAMGFPGDGEDRRPSIAASARTVSSTGSKGSLGGRVHKKLQGFFGEDVVLPGVINDASRQNSEASSVLAGPAQSVLPSTSHMRNRENSVTDAMEQSGPPSPPYSRPRTPVPQLASEVTPWVLQDPDVRCNCMFDLRCSRPLSAVTADNLAECA
jgi:adenylate cyclase